MTQSTVLSLAVMLVMAPGVASGQDSSSHRSCDPHVRSRVAAWREAHATDRDQLTVLGVDSLDTPPEVLSHPLLQYPREAQSAGYEGTVTVIALVDTNGKVSSADALDTRVEAHWRVTNPTTRVSPTSSDLAAWEFRRAAADVIKYARYRPAFRQGKPVATVICTPIVFKISP